MGQDSNIEWTHHTFNPWVGCTKVSAGCANCYAEALMDKRYGKAKWGPGGTRVVKKDWSEPRKWDRLAAAAGERHRVFCASLADVFEGEDTMPAESLPAVRAARVRLFDLIRHTPNLDWLLLTKRPENWHRVIDESLILAEGGDVNDRDYFVKHGESDPDTELGTWLNNWTGNDPPANVWLGTSVENQATADERIPHLLKVPAAVRFLSCEPLLGPIDLTRVALGESAFTALDPAYAHVKTVRFILNSLTAPKTGIPGLSWVIAGGESGPGARPCDIAWARSLVKQCRDAGVAPFVKQLGAKPSVFESKRYYLNGWHEPGLRTLKLKDRKGGDMAEWPEDLRVRQFPEVKHGVD